MLEPAFAVKAHWSGSSLCLKMVFFYDILYFLAKMEGGVRFYFVYIGFGSMKNGVWCYACG